jgi:hypothetical protein
MASKAATVDGDADHAGSLPSRASRMITSLMLSPSLRCKFRLFALF